MVGAGKIEGRKDKSQVVWRFRCKIKSALKCRLKVWLLQKINI